MTHDLQCEYCARPKGERLTCCGEHHWVPMFDWRKDDREWEGITARIDSLTDDDYTDEP